MIGPGLVHALLFVAVAGVFLLFARDWSVRVVGAFLIVPRAVAAPFTDGEVIVLGSGVVAAVFHVVYGSLYAPAGPSEGGAETLTPPEADDTSEAAACVACRGSIPVGSDTCPACGWSYTAR
ncbi:hypothetical protein R5W24_006054 [Gemmata sp. JC717]|uniref:hypothetical protein n=1 Tax=Gemmata algarum TaxID=2975278 RepID=UPI0021BACCAF|nr:hypothetical protein [Gemmata algarum]MDY3556881.1 hypothetical protein [Gemmata algarum]